MNDTVVAKKANLLFGLIVMIVLGAGIIALGVYFGVTRENDKLIFLLFFGIVGLLFIAFGIWQIVKYKKTPLNLITYGDGLFKFADGTTCTPNEITHVLIKLTRQNGIVNSTGGIVITINGARKIEYFNVDKVKAVQETIQRITEEYNAELYKAAQAAAQPADPFEEPAAAAAASEPVSSAETEEAVAPVASVDQVTPVEPFGFSDGGDKNEN